VTDKGGAHWAAVFVMIFWDGTFHQRVDYTVIAPQITANLSVSSKHLIAA